MVLENLIISPTSSLQGTVCIPGDKSITHRALMLSAISNHEVFIHNALQGDDCLATCNILKNLGVSIDVGPKYFKVIGVGLHGLQKPQKILNAGNSGTTIRLLTGILAAQQFDSIITGDASVCSRPMRRIIEPLKLMGAHIAPTAENYAPLHIYGGQNLRAITYHLPVASAQVKSAIILASLYSKGNSKIIESTPSRNHTEKMLDFFSQQNNGRFNIDLQIPGDLSSAAFFIIAACIVYDSNLILPAVGINTTRTGILQVLLAMGANIGVTNLREINCELTGDIHVRTSKLHATEIPMVLIPNIIDELPIIAIAAACATGTTIIRGAQELRYKESDRIKALVCGLRALGIKTEEFDDGLAITGGALSGGCVNAFGDHRIAMAFAIAGMVADQSVIVQDTRNIATSFPDFVATARQTGAIITHSQSEFQAIHEEFYD